ncbi:MAG: GNAT family N-acetyltransferase [Lentisphaerae bacterium]|nr:GNAT family N-acetyltransferase [Lentisphaerota bacterium]
MQVRQVQTRDVPAVLAMMQTYYGFDGLDFDLAAARRRLRLLLRQPTLGMAWIVRAGAEPAGYVFVVRGFGLEHGRNVLIDECYLRPEYQGRGWGPRIVKRVLAYARRVGAESIHAQVERHNRRACGFWAHMGFRRYDRYAMVRMLRG